MAALGVLVAALVLFLVPLGLGLVMLPFQGSTWVTLPGGGGYPVPPWTASLLLVPLGIASFLAGLGSVVAAGRLQRRLAPVFLGPTDADRLAAAERRSADLARANHLARELHDSLGHSLTAITLQADAAERLAAADPAAAAAAARHVGDAARAALDSLDEALASLRRGTPPALGEPTIEGVLADAARLRLSADVGEVPAGLRGVVARVLREALTNAARHGTGTAAVTVAGSGPVVVRVTNPVAAGGWASPGGRGLEGLREAVGLAGGTLDAGASGGIWTLTATLPGVGDG